MPVAAAADDNDGNFAVGAAEKLGIDMLAIGDNVELFNFACLIQKTFPLNFDPTRIHIASAAEILY